MKIALIGAGQMGGYYANNLVNKCGFPATDIVCFDRIHDRSTALAQKYGVTVADSLPMGLDAGIVATNTPSHHELVETLARTGTNTILVEKPTAQDPEGLEHILRNITNAQIYTGLVINFSQALGWLLERMNSDNTKLLDFNGRWGKNRGMANEKRPTVGDMEDEAVHMIGVLFSLLANRSFTTVTVSAQLGWLPYVNQESQQTARALDASFPQRPNHSTSANIRLHGANDELRAHVYSSFLHSKETRLVGGLLGQLPNEVIHSFEIKFDQKRPEKTGGSVDIIRLIDVKTNECEEEEFQSDKLNDLTRAFLDAASGKKVDKRLVQIKEAGALVKTADAILRSDRDKGLPKIFSW